MERNLKSKGFQRGIRHRDWFMKYMCCLSALEVQGPGSRIPKKPYAEGGYGHVVGGSMYKLEGCYSLACEIVRRDEGRPKSSRLKL